MKMDAIFDYNQVVQYCEQNNLPIYEPKGKSTHKIEDATVLMIKRIGIETEFIKLHRGVAYYLGLI